MNGQPDSLPEILELNKTVVTCTTQLRYNAGFAGAPAIVAGVEVRRIKYRFLHNKLFEISIDDGPEHFYDFKLSITARFGSPSTSDPEKMANGCGAIFTGEHRKWVGGNTMIELHEMHLERDKLYLTIYDKDLL